MVVESVHSCMSTMAWAENSHARWLCNFYQLSFLEFDVNVFISNNFFIHSKIFQSHQMLRSCSQIFTAHHSCSNADSNLVLVVAQLISDSFFK